jgi:hypothetical protein
MQINVKYLKNIDKKYLNAGSGIQAALLYDYWKSEAENLMDPRQVEAVPQRLGQ